MTKTLSPENLPLAYNSKGVIRIGQTRISLETLIDAFTKGATAEEIVQQYPTLRLADVYQVIGYDLHHSEEIEKYLSERKSIAESVRQMNETRYDPKGIRDRLILRYQCLY